MTSNKGEDLDNDTSSQDTSDQQEASDKQKPIDVEKTKQKLTLLITAPVAPRL
jgi:hypothetical protein